MGRLVSTEGLTEDQQEILKLVRQFVEKEIIPVATDLEHKDEYPTQIVESLKELGIFGLMIPEEFGGLGESLLTYALVVEEIGDQRGRRLGVLEEAEHGPRVEDDGHRPDSRRRSASRSDDSTSTRSVPSNRPRSGRRCRAARTATWSP